MPERTAATARQFSRRWWATALQLPRLTVLIAGRSDPAESPLSPRGRELAGQELGPRVTPVRAEDGRPGRAQGIRHLPHRAGFPVTPDGPLVFGRRQQGSHGEPVREAVPSGTEVEGAPVPWSDPPDDGPRAGAPFADAAAIPLAAAPEREYEPPQPTTSRSHHRPPPRRRRPPATTARNSPFRRIRVSWTRGTIRDASGGPARSGAPLATGIRRPGRATVGRASPAALTPVGGDPPLRAACVPLSGRNRGGSGRGP